MSEAKPEEKQPTRQTVEHWAKAAGHIPGPQSPQNLHTGPHVRVVLVHSGLAINSLVTQAEYDAAVAAAYSVPVG